MPNYQNSKIYKIVDKTNDNIYIGSTTKQMLSQRLAQHVYDFRRYKKGTYNYVLSFEIIKNNNFFIELLEMFPCNCKDELFTREQYHILNNKCINKCVPARSLTMPEYKNKYFNRPKQTCACGGLYSYGQNSHHILTQRHKNYLNSVKSN